MDNKIQYPELYQKVYPKVQKCILRYYPPYLPIYKIPNQNQLEIMIDEVYDEMLEEHPEIGEDLKEKRNLSSKNASMQRPYYGRGNIFKSFIWLVLLGDLLKRRKSYGPGAPGYQPGYPGYNPGYYPGGPGYQPGPGYGPGGPGYPGDRPDYNPYGPDFDDYTPRYPGTRR